MDSPPREEGLADSLDGLGLFGMNTSISFTTPITTRSTGQVFPIPQAGIYSPSRNVTPRVIRTTGAIRLRGFRICPRGADVCSSVSADLVPMFKLIPRGGLERRPSYALHIADQARISFAPQTIATIDAVKDNN